MVAQDEKQWAVKPTVSVDNVVFQASSSFDGSEAYNAESIELLQNTTPTKE